MRVGDSVSLKYRLSLQNKGYYLTTRLQIVYVTHIRHVKFYKFIAVFTTANDPYFKPNDSSPYFHTLFNTNFNNIFLSTHLLNAFLLSGFLTQTLCAFIIFPIVAPWICSPTQRYRISYFESITLSFPHPNNECTLKVLVKVGRQTLFIIHQEKKKDLRVYLPTD